MLWFRPPCPAVLRQQWHHKLRAISGQAFPTILEGKVCSDKNFESTLSSTISEGGGIGGV